MAWCFQATVHVQLSKDMSHAITVNKFKHYKVVKRTIEIVWFNSNIKIHNERVYFKEMHEKGAVYISDL